MTFFVSRFWQALIEPDGRILLMYHGSSCLPKSDPERLTGERLGIAEAAHWNATFAKRPGGPIVAPSNGTGSHGKSRLANESICASSHLPRNEHAVWGSGTFLLLFVLQEL